MFMWQTLHPRPSSLDLNILNLKPHADPKPRTLDPLSPKPYISCKNLSNTRRRESDAVALILDATCRKP